MAVTAYRVLKAPITQMESLMAAAIADGWQPLGAPFAQFPDSAVIYQALTKGTPDGGGGGPVNITINDIQDAGAAGKTLMAAETDADARAAINAGTSNLELGNTASTAMPGNTAIPEIPGAATPTNDGLMAAADKAKLDDIAANATANDTDANLKNRQNHTGTQPVSSIEGLESTLSDIESRLSALEAE